MADYFLGSNPEKNRKEDAMSEKCTINPIISLAHEVAREALRIHENEHRWLRSETTVNDRGDGVFAVRIRAELLFVPLKPDGTWITISTTVEERYKQSYFPGSSITLEFPWRWEDATYRIQSFEGGYSNLIDFLVHKEGRI